MKNRYLHHICIQTNTYEESLTFYTDVMGFTTVKETKDFHNRRYNTWLESNGFMIELQTPKIGEELQPFHSSVEGIVHFCLCVVDIQQEYQRMKSCGPCTFLSKGGDDIYTVEQGQLFKIVAPEGTIIEFRDNTAI